MFTSRYFSQLEWVWRGRGGRRFYYPRADDSRDYFPTLLREAGVLTASFVSPNFIGSEHGIALGFAEERSFGGAGGGHATSKTVVRSLIRRLKKVGDEPAFFFAHLPDAHHPYDSGELRSGSPYARYLSELGRPEAQVHRIWRVLRKHFPKRGYLIISSDHGEAFAEHGTFKHAQTVYGELIDVPLMVLGPGIEASSDQRRVGLIDLGPTLLELFGVETPRSYMGASLLPILGGSDASLPRPLAAESRLKRAFFASNGLKVIEDLRRKTVEAYDLEADPRELNNIFDSDRVRALAALGELRAFFEGPAKGPASTSSLLRR
jgi:hypothetical protein